ncbi:hypothetical protein [Bradyrhizobium sp. F1.13.3]|uniref:hypothetical protein n=1 Tax=Bradyrhizobium sp. F1.13.3 TaxID=3156351 RepID=UPI003397F267
MTFEQQRGGIRVIAPDHVSNVQTADGKMRNVEIIDGQRVVFLSHWGDFVALLRGREGLMWDAANSGAGGALERMAATNIGAFL